MGRCYGGFSTWTPESFKMYPFNWGNQRSWTPKFEKRPRMFRSMTGMMLWAISQKMTGTAIHAPKKKQYGGMH